MKKGKKKDNQQKQIERDSEREREKTWKLRCCANYGMMEGSKVLTNLVSKPCF